MSDTTKTQIDLFIYRHGMTSGNIEKRYVGAGTDEPLTKEGMAALTKADLAIDVLYVSPMLRARQTAGILFPGVTAIAKHDLRETEFGQFENKNYKDLDGNEDYQAWIDGGGIGAFPGGESRADFVNRTMPCLETILCKEAERGNHRIGLVAHGGTIMAALSTWTKEDYYKFHVDNGEGYHISLEIDLEKQIHVISYAGISCRLPA